MIVADPYFSLMAFDKEWMLHFRYPSIDKITADLAGIAKAHPEYTRFRVVRATENVVMEISREDALDTKCSLSQAAASCP